MTMKFKRKQLKESLEFGDKTVLIVGIVLLSLSLLSFTYFAGLTAGGTISGLVTA